MATVLFVRHSFYWIVKTYNETLYEISCLLDLDQYQCKEEGMDQESIQSTTTPDPGNHMGK